MLLNYKIISIFYFLFSLLGSLIGFSLSVIIRVELNNSFSVLGEYFYYVSLTSHAVIMVFYFLTTISVGFYYYFLPSKCLLNGMYSSVLTLISFFCYIFSFVILIFSLLLGEGINSSWTLYTPLTLYAFNNCLSLDFAILSLILFSISSILNSVNILITITNSFINFESLLDVSIFVWSAFLTSFLVLFSTPSLICVLIMLISDRNFGTYYFDCEFGGDPVLFQSIFWIWGHPEVYILILPVFGLVSDCIFSLCGGLIPNKNGIIFSMISLTILSFLVWGHHMVTVGWDLDIKGFFMISTVIISIPTGVKVFSWVYAMFLYGVRFNTVVLSLNFFIFTFILGGITGVVLSNYSLDILYHDSYFVVGHFHTILAGSTVFGMLSSLISFNYRHSRPLVNFLISLFFISIYQILISFYLKGILGVPRRVSNYFLEYYYLFYLGSVGVIGVWILVFIFLLYLNLSLNLFKYLFCFNRVLIFRRPVRNNSVLFFIFNKRNSSTSRPGSVKVYGEDYPIKMIECGGREIVDAQFIRKVVARFNKYVSPLINIYAVDSLGHYVLDVFLQNHHKDWDPINKSYTIYLLRVNQRNIFEFINILNTDVYLFFDDRYKDFLSIYCLTPLKITLPSYEVFSPCTWDKIALLNQENVTPVHFSRCINFLSREEFKDLVLTWPKFYFNNHSDLNSVFDLSLESLSNNPSLLPYNLINPSDYCYMFNRYLSNFHLSGRFIGFSTATKPEFTLEVKYHDPYPFKIFKVFYLHLLDHHNLLSYIFLINGHPLRSIRLMDIYLSWYLSGLMKICIRIREDLDEVPLIVVDKNSNSKSVFKPSLEFIQSWYDKDLYERNLDFILKFNKVYPLFKFQTVFDKELNRSYHNYKYLPKSNKVDWDNPESIYYFRAKFDSE